MEDVRRHIQPLIQQYGELRAHLKAANGHTILGATPIEAPLDRLAFQIAALVTQLRRMEGALLQVCLGLAYMRAPQHMASASAACAAALCAWAARWACSWR